MIGNLNQNPLKNDRWKQRATDLVFATALLTAAVYFILTAPYGLTVTDEVQYPFVCLRLMEGDKLFADNWLIVGAQSVFQYLPFRIFYAVRGSVDGLVLAMRYLYVGIKLIFCVYLYLRLRKYALWAVFAAVFFVGTDLFGIKTTSYYSIFPQCILLVGMLLFVRENTKPFDWVLAGFFLSCSVLAFPPAAMAWLLYCVLIVVRRILQKRGKPFLEDYGFVLSVQVWVWMLIGICITAILFFILCAIFFTGTDLRAILFGIKSIFGFVGAGPVTKMNFFRIRISKLKRYFRMMHPALVIVTGAVFAGGLLSHRKFPKLKKPFFAALCFLCAAITIRLLLYPTARLNDASGECCCHPLILAVPALEAYAFTRNKNRRIFGFMMLVTCASCIADVYSMNTFGAFLLPGCVPSVLLLRAYYLETQMQPDTETNQKRLRKYRSVIRTRKVWSAVICILLILFPALEVWHYAYMAQLHETERLFVHSEAPLDARIEQGILKGVITTQEIRDNYDKSARDAARCQALCRKALFVVDYDTSVYVSAGCPVSTPFLHYDTDDYAREETWWSVHPERRPDVVYIPYFTLSYIPNAAVSAQDYLSYFEENANVTVNEGEIGYIVQIHSWNT